MRDRTPTKVLDNGALRYGVYDESGTFLRHEYLALDDAPTDTGTDLSKATLLADETEVSLFGSAADRTVDDAFRGLAGQLKLIMGDMAQITVTLTDSAGTAIPGVLVQGILSDSGQAVYSDDSGVVSGYISEGTQTIKVTGYADIEDYSETLSVTKGTAITKAVTLTTRNFLKITSSQSVKFSGNVEKVDFTVGGGGGGAGRGKQYSYYHVASGGGGGGGYAVSVTDVEITPDLAYPAVIGAGGAAASDGGSSSFMGTIAAGGAKGGDTTGGSTTSSLKGGASGTGNGNGGAGVAGYGASSSLRTSVGNDGAAGSQTIFTSFTESSPYGGGGGSGGALTNGGAGGSPGGGAGGNGVTLDFDTVSVGKNGTDGLGGGGGSGGVRHDKDNSDGTRYIGDPGKGGSGCVAIRMHLKSAA